MKKLFFLLFFAACITPSLYSDTVVTIHGFLTNARSMKRVKCALERFDTDIYLFEYPSRRRYLKEHAQDLVCHLQQIAAQCPGRPIHFVSHSIGALVLRCALNQIDCPEEARIGKAVLVAPPNQGSELARRFANFALISFAMGSKAGWELMHYAPWQIANCCGEFPECMQVLVIAGSKGNKILFDRPNDGYLGIEETRLNTPYYFKCFPYTHGELLDEPSALLTMRQFIQAQ